MPSAHYLQQTSIQEQEAAKQAAAEARYRASALDHARCRILEEARQAGLNDWQAQNLVGALRLGRPGALYDLDAVTFILRLPANAEQEAGRLALALAAIVQTINSELLPSASKVRARAIPPRPEPDGQTLLLGLSFGERGRLELEDALIARAMQDEMIPSFPLMPTVGAPKIPDPYSSERKTSAFMGITTGTLGDYSYPYVFLALIRSDKSEFGAGFSDFTHGADPYARFFARHKIGGGLEFSALVQIHKPSAASGLPTRSGFGMGLSGTKTSRRRMQRFSLDYERFWDHSSSGDSKRSWLAADRLGVIYHTEYHFSKDWSAWIAPSASVAMSAMMDSRPRAWGRAEWGLQIGATFPQFEGSGFYWLSVRFGTDASYGSPKSTYSISLLTEL